MKCGVMRTGRNSSGRRPSLRLNCSLRGVESIRPPDFDGFEDARRAPQKPLGDARETLRRVGHVKVVEVVAQPPRARALLQQAPRVRVELAAAKALRLQHLGDGLG